MGKAVTAARSAFAAAVLQPRVDREQIPQYGLSRRSFEKDVTYFGEAEFHPAITPVTDELRATRELLRHADARMLPRPYYYVAEDARVAGTLIWDTRRRGRRLVLEQFPRQPVDGKHVMQVGLKNLVKCRFHRRLGTHTEIEYGYLLSTPFWFNYYHFMFDAVLPLVELLEIDELSTESLELLACSELNSWQRELVGLLGIDVDRQVVNTRGKLVAVKRMLVASPRHFKGTISTAALQTLRRRILGRLGVHEPEASKLVYVSRAGAGRRRVTNEEQLVRALEARGFLICRLEEMSVAEQVRLFAAARVVVAAHGAGLANLAFADSPIVVELFPTDWWDLGHYVPLSHAVGGRHHPVLGNWDAAEDSFKVDTDRVAALLDEVMA
jgi:hypothetical protein